MQFAEIEDICYGNELVDELDFALDIKSVRD